MQAVFRSIYVLSFFRYKRFYVALLFLRIPYVITMCLVYVSFQGEMKKQDQLLMCKFIQLRSDIHQLKFTSSRRKSRNNKSNITGSCSDILETKQSSSTQHQNDAASSLIKFQSTMTLDRHRGHERSPHNHDMLDDDEDDDDDDDDDDDEDEEYEDDEDEMTCSLTEPEYFPEFRPRTMSLLPPIQAKRFRMARMRTSRNKSFSAPGTAENTDRGLTDLVE